MTRALRRSRAVLAAAALTMGLALAAKNLEPKPDNNIISRLIVNILSEEHYASAPVDDALSRQLFDEYLDILDPGRMYFTQRDVEALKGYQTQLDDCLRRGDTQFAFDAYNLLLRKVKQREDFAAAKLKDGFDFTSDEDYVFDRSKALWAKDEAELDGVWCKKLKYDILNFRLMEKAAKDDPELRDKKAPSSPKPPEERVLKRLSTYRHYLEENDAM